MPPIDHILETSLYVADIGVAERFYADLFELQVYMKDAQRHVLFKLGDSMLLLFNAAETRKGGDLPAHGAAGPGHVAFRVAHEELPFWRRRLQTFGVAIEREVTWPSGGESIYFRDPFGNSLELATADTWPERE